MENNLWQCTCGAQNEGNFCASCGKRKPGTETIDVDSYSEQYLKLQIRQQELLQAQEEKRLAAKEEEERKRKELENKKREYDIAYNGIPSKYLKSTMGSWLLLLLSIFATAAFCCYFVSFAMHLSGWFTILRKFISVLLSGLLCIGFWRTYISGKRKNSKLDSCGPKMMNGILIFYQVIATLIMTLIFIILIILMIRIGRITQSTDQSGNAELADASSTATGRVVAVFLGLCIVDFIIIALITVYFTITRNFCKHTVDCIGKNDVSLYNCIPAAIFFFIVGIISLITAISSLNLFSFSNILGQYTDNLGSLGSMISNFMSNKADYAKALAKLFNAVVYIFTGILAIKFNSLYNEIQNERKLLEIPE